MEPDGSADAVTWVTDRIAITNFVTAHRPGALAGAGALAVLCLDRGLAGGPAADRGVACVRVAHLVDGDNPPQAFAGAVAALGELLAGHDKVVVHCRAGRSRSVAVVAAHLVASEGMSPDAALAFVAARRPAAVAAGLVRLVRS